MGAEIDPMLAQVLIADDDPDDRFLILRALSRCDADLSASAVRDGVELIAHLHGRQARSLPLPRLVLLDLNMPRMDGREVLRQVRSNSSLKDLRVVVLTTSVQHEEGARALALGASACFSKPESFAALVDLLRPHVSAAKHREFP